MLSFQSYLTILAILVATLSCKSSASPTVRFPKVKQVTWTPQQDSMLVTVRFEQPLEIDSLEVHYTLKLFGQEDSNYEMSRISTLRGNEIQLYLHRDYFTGLSYDSLRKVKPEDLFGSAYIFAKPIGGHLELIKKNGEKGNQDYHYFNFKVFHRKTGSEVIDILTAETNEYEMHWRKYN